ncbi:MAG: hypothetical protein CM15mV7_1770 [uncultured marine virus]|nr:MAG: hypothetical protein CM15mV7_1770 [uncultured marine virus]
MTTWNQQIENRNFLSPIGFKFLLAKYPKVVYFAQSANIPAINANAQQQQATPYRPLPLDGFISYDPLNLTFLIDEDLQNYLILHNWIRGLGTPDSVVDREEFVQKNSKNKVNNDDDNILADATLAVLNSNFQSNFFCSIQRYSTSILVSIGI